MWSKMTGTKSTFNVGTDGVTMCAEVFNGKLIRSHAWWEKNCSESCSFEVGSLKLSKAELVGSVADVRKSFPDWYFNVVEAPAAQANGTVTCVVEATGTHTGEPYACMPGWEAIPATGRTVKNDPERVTTFFNDEGKIVKQIVESLPGGKGFIGPPGLYLQIGGRLPFNAATDGVAMLAELCNGKPIWSLDWWETNLSEDFSIEAGSKRFSKAANLAMISDLCKSFPGWYCDVVEAPAVQADGTVMLVARTIGIHTGEPYACMPGVEAIPATGIACASDPAKIITFFNDQGKIMRQTSEPLPGGRVLPVTRGFYRQIGGTLPFDVATDGVAMCAEVFGSTSDGESRCRGEPIQMHAWWGGKDWSEDSSFEVGPVKLSKAELAGTAADLGKSFPDWLFNVIEAPAAQADGTVTFVVEAVGTHTGEPYACMPGVEAIPAMGKSIKNDLERMTAFFSDEGKIMRLTIEALPGGKGFVGPPGFYLQIGGRLPFNAATDGVAMLAELGNGNPIWSPDWWERNLSEDFSIEAGSKRFSKATLLAMISDLCKSFPGWHYEVVEAPAMQADGTVMLVARTIGIHTGEPYACMPGVEAIPATGIACASDPSKVITFFNDQGKIMRQTSEPLPGGRVLPVTRGFYRQIGGTLPFDVMADGVAMCAEVFNGKSIPSHEWWEKNCSESCSFEVGSMKSSKDAVVGMHVDICKSFPDFCFNILEAPAAQADGTVTCVVEATGTHTGEAYACMPGLEAIPTTGRFVKNEPEKVTTFFNDEGKIVRQTVEPLSDGKGFGGPPGFYLQIGGVIPCDDLKPEPVSPTSPIRGGS